MHSIMHSAVVVIIVTVEHRYACICCLAYSAETAHIAIARWTMVQGDTTNHKMVFSQSNQNVWTYQ